MTGGSKPGERRGGRQKGTPNKLTVEREMRATHGLEAARTGLMPLDVMFARMRDEPMTNGRKPTDEQFQAAVAAAPFVHPRLAAVAVKALNEPDPRLVQQAAAARLELMRRLDELAVPSPLMTEREKPGDPVSNAAVSVSVMVGDLGGNDRTLARNGANLGLARPYRHNHGSLSVRRVASLRRMRPPICGRCRDGSRRSHLPYGR